MESVLRLQRTVGNAATARMILDRAPQLVVQRRTAVPLADQVTGHELTGKVPELIAAYDKLADADIYAQGKLLRQIIDIPDCPPPVKQAVEKELAQVDAEIDYLTKLLNRPDGAYDLMTERGIIWSYGNTGRSTTETGLTGRKYFAHLSQQNVDQLRAENDMYGHKWIASLRPALIGSLLNDFVVSHYTEAGKVENLKKTGFKTRAGMTLEDTTITHNTQPFDDHALANTAFVFFFIEDKATNNRGTRFGNRRITYGLEESTLLSDGWVMLADLNNRRLPTLVANKDNDLESASSPTGEQELENKGYTSIIRRLARPTGMPALPPPPPGLTKERRQAYSEAAMAIESDRVRNRTGGEETSKLQYGVTKTMEKVGSRQRPNYTAVLEHPELLHQNVLVGADIVTGLVERLLADIARIMSVSPAVGDKLAHRSPKELIQYLLNDVVRLQVMVPHPPPVTDDRITEQGGKS